MTTNLPRPGTFWVHPTFAGMWRVDRLDAVLPGKPGDAIELSSVDGAGITTMRISPATWPQATGGEMTPWEPGVINAVRALCERVLAWPAEDDRTPIAQGAARTARDVLALLAGEDGDA